MEKNAIHSAKKIKVEKKSVLLCKKIRKNKIKQNQHPYSQPPFPKSNTQRPPKAIKTPTN